MHLRQRCHWTTVTEAPLPAMLVAVKQKWWCHRMLINIRRKKPDHRNTKAMAIHAFMKACTGMGILNAAELSADVGVCSKSVRQWATEFLEATQKWWMDEDLIQDLMYKNNFTFCMFWIPGHQGVCPYESQCQRVTEHGMQVLSCLGSGTLGSWNTYMRRRQDNGCTSWDLSRNPQQKECILMAISEMMLW